MPENPWNAFLASPKGLQEMSIDELQKFLHDMERERAAHQKGVTPLPGLDEDNGEPAATATDDIAPDSPFGR